jgi:hypothetical protein
LAASPVCAVLRSAPVALLVAKRLSLCKDAWVNIRLKPLSVLVRTVFRFCRKFTRHDNTPPRYSQSKSENPSKVGHGGRRAQGRPYSAAPRSCSPNPGAHVAGRIEFTRRLDQDATVTAPDKAGGNPAHRQRNARPRCAQKEIGNHRARDGWKRDRSSPRRGVNPRRGRTGKAKAPPYKGTERVSRYAQRPPQAEGMSAK